MELYEITERIGDGGNGSLFKVRHRHTGIVYAMKIIRNREDGRREAEILKTLHGTGFPKCVDHYEEDGDFYLIMEFKEGKELGGWVQTINDGYKEESVGRILYRIAGLLKDLHSLPVPLIHGDLKPENILVDAYGNLFLVDFGSAFYIDRPPKKILSTKGYAAPELADGRCGTSADVYAFGKMMCTLYTGKPVRVFNGEVTEKVLIRMGMSPRMAEIAAKCMQPFPSRRYPSGKELYRILGIPEKRSISLQRLNTDIGGILSFTGLFCYYLLHEQRGKWVLFLGLMLLIPELILEHERRERSKEEFRVEASLFLSDGENVK